MIKKKLLILGLVVPMLVLAGCTTDTKTPDEIDFGKELPVTTAPGWDKDNAEKALGDGWSLTDQKTSPATFFYTNDDGSCTVSYTVGMVQENMYKNQDDLFVSQTLKQDQVDSTGGELINTGKLQINTTDNSSIEMVESTYSAPNMIFEEIEGDLDPNAPAPEMIQDGTVNTRSAIRFFNQKVENPNLWIIDSPDFDGNPDEFPKEVFPIIELSYSCVNQDLDALVWDKATKNIKIDLNSAPKTQAELLNEIEEK